MVMVHKFRVGTGKDVPGYLAEALGDPPTYETVRGREPVGTHPAHDRRGPPHPVSDPEGSFSDNLFEAFPKATRLAFTGTPLITDRHARKTVDRFGDYIDKYKMHDAGRSTGRRSRSSTRGGRRTPPSRTRPSSTRNTKNSPSGTSTPRCGRNENVELVRRMAGRERRVFEDLCRERTDEEILAIKKKYGTRGDIFEAEERIEEIAEDLVRPLRREHPAERVQGPGRLLLEDGGDPLQEVHRRGRRRPPGSRKRPSRSGPTGPETSRIERVITGTRSSSSGSAS